MAAPSSSAAPVAVGAPARDSGRYRLFWRWHFYAGLFVLPVLVLLAVSGAVYLFERDIGDALHPELRFAATPWTAQVPAGAMVLAAEAAVPGATATRIDVPDDRTRTARVHLAVPGEGRRIAFVDPGDGRVAGTQVYERTLVGLADRLHGTLLIGKTGSYLIELVASWAVLLVLTGLYLAWPRGGLAAWRRALWPRLRGGGRGAWRSLHAAVGWWVAGLVLFLIFTGLPWSAFWGGWVRSGAEAMGAGYPAAYRRYVAEDAPVLGDDFVDVPWTLQNAPLPPAAGDAGHAHHAPPSAAAAVDGASRGWGPAGLQRAVDHARAHGLAGDLRVFLPSGAGAPVTAYNYPGRPQDQVTFHFDAQGAPLLQVTFQDYGLMAQGIELGVQLHMGRYFGRANQALMLSACIGVVVLSVTGTVMWWRRRPTGRLGAPRGHRPAPTAGLLALIAAAAVVLPMLAASLLVVLLFDRLALARWPALAWLR
ncbi:PepSY-associated TM helix domain-containing protein [Luteimonas abyssi]|uniref:PepSY-associated TM helix domain-containing protein n=1 Tax=Luteimonas abyssi TaxID=1247514 RepID=UPI0009E932FE|nr:PepSY domain-containing protein [Luteimonas abyssi]